MSRYPGLVPRGVNGDVGSIRHHGVLPAARQHPTEAAHPAPRPRRPAVLRGTDGRGGLLLGLVAALPPRDPVGDRRRPAVGAARPGDDPERAAAAPAPAAARPVRRGDRRPTSSPAAGSCWATTTCGSPTSSPARRHRCTATPSATNASTSSRARRRWRRCSARSQARQGDYVLIPRATTHRWLPTGDEPLRAYCIEANSHITPARRYLSKFGQLLEHAPYCERDLHGPGEPLLGEGTDVEVYIKHRGAARPRHRRHRSTSTRNTRSTSSAGTAASTRTRSTSPTSSRSPAGCTSRRRSTRCSRATTSSSATSSRARSTTTRCRSRCRTTTPTSTPTR